MGFIGYLCILGFAYWIISTGHHKNLKQNFKQILNLFSAHPKGPRPVPKNIKPSPFRKNQFKTQEIKLVMDFFERTCDFDIQPESDTSNLIFKTNEVMSIIVNNVSNYKGNYDGYLYTLVDSNNKKNVYGVYTDREEIMDAYWKRVQENKLLQETVNDAIKIKKKIANGEDRISRMKADLEKDFD